MPNLNHPKPPEFLVQLQTWFKQAVVKDPDVANQTDGYAFFITPSSKQDSAERLSIYTQDFWPRCLESLSDDFKLLKRYLTPPRFTALMKQYILCFPSRSFTLFHLGQDVPVFLESHYQEPDRDWVIQLSHYEWAYMKAFMASNVPALQGDMITPDFALFLMQSPLTFHPSVSLLKSSYTVSDHTIKSQVPPLSQPTYLVVYRKNFKNQEKQVSEVFFRLLCALQDGKSIVATLETLPSLLTVEQCDELEKNVQSWFETCIREEWFLNPKEENNGNQ